MKRSIFLNSSRVVGPKSFSYTTPSWLTMKVFTPVTSYSAGAATRAKPPIITPLTTKSILSERRGGSLPLQNLEEIAVIRLGAAGVALFDGARDVFPDRPAPRAVGVLPRQAILLARSADDALRILVHVVALRRAEGVFVLRLHVAAADLDGVQLIGADAAVEVSCRPALPSKNHLLPLLHDRDGKRPVLVADEQERAAPFFGSTETLFFSRASAAKSAACFRSCANSPLKYNVLATRGQRCA